MNLLQIRTLVTDKSGRFDLVVDATDYVDNGADFLINAGQRYLDRKAGIDDLISRFFKQISAGDYAVILQHCRAIHEVWVANTENRLQLRKIDMDRLRGTHYPSGVNAYVEPPETTDQDRPIYYSPASLRMAPDSDDAISSDLGGYVGYLDIIYGDPSTYNGIVMMPPADGAYMVEVIGNFYSRELSSNTDYSFWSSRHPDILVMAALREMEIFNRNSEGVKDWTAAILDKLIDVEMDSIEQSSWEDTQLEG